MARRFNSHAERVAKVAVLVRGARDLGADMKPVELKLKQLDSELGVYMDADAKQEKLKSELNLATKAVNKSADAIDGLYSSIVDFAYSVYGKKGDQLKEMGLAPWPTGKKPANPKPKA